MIRADFFADIGERVFGLVMADCVGDYVSVNYFVELPSPSVILMWPCDIAKSSMRIAIYR